MVTSFTEYVLLGEKFSDSVFLESFLLIYTYFNDVHFLDSRIKYESLNQKVRQALDQ